MKSILTAAEMKIAEDYSDQNGVSYEELMLNAGTASAQRIRTHAKHFHRVTILAGKGNNAGDAFVIARDLLDHSYQVKILLLKEAPFSSLATKQWDKLPNPDEEQFQIIPCYETAQQKEHLHSLIAQSDLILDAVFGTGFQGQVPNHIAELFEICNHSEAYRIALDLPSGLYCDTGEYDIHTFRADETYTFGAYKPALVMEDRQKYYGIVRCINIGLLFP